MLDEHVRIRFVFEMKCEGLDSVGEVVFFRKEVAYFESLQRGRPKECYKVGVWMDGYQRS